MKNNEIGKVAVGSGSHKNARFNLSHDVNSTYQFGEVQPVLFRDMIAGEKDVVDIESMVRLAPMVAPTFGRVVHKEWHHFIPTTDLFPHYGNFLAQTTYRNQLPTKLPSMSICFLSYMCLAGARMSIYRGNTYTGTDFDPANAPYQLLRNENITTTTSDINNLLGWIKTSQGITGDDNYPFGYIKSASSTPWNMSAGHAINLKYLLNPYLIQYIYGRAAAYRDMTFPSGNWDTTDWFDFADKSYGENSASKYVTDVTPVLLDSADAVIPYTITYSGTNRNLLLAFRFSNFGKRLYKILTGLGYVLDFESTTRVSLLPLFAFYKAWFDDFGLTRYKSWTDSAAYVLLNKYDFSPTSYDFNQVFDSNVGNFYSWDEWVSFIVELGNCWVTEETDFVNAHVRDVPLLSGNDQSSGMFSVVPDVNKKNSVVSRSSLPVPNAGGTQSNPDITMDALSASISALQIKQVMQMYRWLNRNSVAGRACEDLLRAQGYGYFLYSCKSNFIGYTEQHVQVYDVTSSSDTFDTSNGDGALLGQQAGRGIGVDKSKTLTFEADEDGFWIGLCAVVPKSGYSQCLNPSLVALDKFSRYNPDLDGKYMVLSPKSFVRGNKPFSSLKQFDTLKDAFGFIPIYSGLKIANNVSNGGFSLRSQRKIFEPYMLDKVLDVGERQIIPYGVSTSKLDFRVIKRFEQLPVAGEFWRYLGRYGWLGNLERIFARAVTNGDELNIELQTATPSDSSFEYLVNSDDNIMVHHVVNQIAYSPMLPIEESFATEDEDGNFDTSLEQH